MEPPMPLEPPVMKTVLLVRVKAVGEMAG